MKSGRVSGSSKGKTGRAGKAKGNASGGATGKVSMPAGHHGTQSGKSLTAGGKGKSRSSSKGNTGSTPYGSGAGSATHC